MRGPRAVLKEIHPLRQNKYIFVFVNIVTSLIWLRFLVRLVAQWNLMKPDLRYSVIYFMVLFFFSWLIIVRDKKEFVSPLLACAILATVYRIVWVLV